MTPEGKVKAAVKRYLKSWDVFTDWPVPSGFGKSTLDCMVICNGSVMWIETKAKGKVLTDRQASLAHELDRHGCEIIVIDTHETYTQGYVQVFHWMERHRAKRLK